MSWLETANGAISRKRKRFSRLSHPERCGYKFPRALQRGPESVRNARTWIAAATVRRGTLITQRIAASPSAARSNANRSGIYRAKWYRPLAFRPTLIAISPTGVVLFALRFVPRCGMPPHQGRNQFARDLSPSFIIRERSHNGWSKCLGALSLMYAKNAPVIYVCNMNM